MIPRFDFSQGGSDERPGTQRPIRPRPASGRLQLYPLYLDDLDLLSSRNISPCEQRGVVAMSKADLVQRPIYANAENGFGGLWRQHRSIPTVECSDVGRFRWPQHDRDHTAAYHSPTPCPDRLPGRGRIRRQQGDVTPATTAARLSRRGSAPRAVRLARAGDGLRAPGGRTRHAARLAVSCSTWWPPRHGRYGWVPEVKALTITSPQRTCVR